MTKKQRAKKEVKFDYGYLAYVFSEAGKITLTLVFYPVGLLLIGVFIDKNLSTIPLFTIISVIAGIFLAVRHAVKVGKEVKKYK